MGVLRRCFREDFPEEVTSRLRTEAGVGISAVMCRKAKASSEEPSEAWDGVQNSSEGYGSPLLVLRRGR